MRSSPALGPNLCDHEHKLRPISERVVAATQ